VSPDVKKKKRLALRGICYLGSAEKETEATSAWVKSLGEKPAMADYFTEIKLEEIKRDKFRGREVTRFKVLGE
jgi:hypothetical protein